MARGKRRHKSSAGRFVMVTHFMLAHPKWRALSPNARSVYLEVKARYDGRNNGLIPYSSREAAAALNASNDTGARALRELVGAGFLVVTEESDFNRKVHLARTYRLTEHASDLAGESRVPSAEWKAPLPSHPKIQESVRPIGHHSTTDRTVPREREAKVA